MRIVLNMSAVMLLLLLITGCDNIGDTQTLASIEDPPQMQIEGTAITLLAKEPDIVTPTGVQVDDQNRIWVIENHTHVRQDDYPGPKVDRILIFSGYLDGNGKKEITEFATDFTDGMSLSFSGNGTVLVTTRASIIEFTDLDGDDIADQRKTLISLETEEKFPHNGMSGLVVSPDGKLYFQCGENFGAYYEISGSDGITLKGKEREGGSLYRCNLDGSNLERIGTAVWNCFAMTFDDFGNLFAVENDPDSRPPCRLLHIVKGGNYGFQFQHGRDGLSPLTSWFGQLPGTLPMVAGTGEAPSGVLYYEQEQFGTATKGSLLVTSWGDNEIQSFQLKQKGSSFSAEPRSFVKGSRDFYPVGLAIDDQGAVIATDWASVSYAVHGKGRIWRISNSNTENKKVGLPSNQMSKQELLDRLNAYDPRVRAKAADLLVSEHGSELKDHFQWGELSDRGKMNLIWGAQLANHEELPNLLELALNEKHELLRSAAVRTLIEQNIVTDEQYYLNLLKDDPSAFVKREAVYGLHSKNSFESVVTLFENDDPFIHTAIIETFGLPANLDFLVASSQSSNPDTRLGSLLCLRRSGADKAKEVIPNFLNDEALANRIAALKWVAEDNLKTFRDQVEKSFSKTPEITSELFDAYVVTFQYLDGEFNQDSHFMEGDEHVSKSFYKRQKFLLATASNPKLNFQIRARALSGINPLHPDLSTDQLQEFVESPNLSIQIEATRSLGSRIVDGAAIKTLQRIAADNKLNQELRLEAIVGLANTASSNQDSKKVLLNLLQKENQVLKDEAARSLEHVANDPEVAPFIEDYHKSLPNTDLASSMDYWRELARENGEAIAGARTFFNPRYQCSSCHRVDGRGGIFGPDLSKVGSNANRERIVESILNPSDIVTPAYTGYSVTSENGDVTVGRLDKDLDSKRHLQMIVVNGERAAVAYDEITEQKMLDQSLMPAGLHRRMTADEFRDLVQYLADLK